MQVFKDPCSIEHNQRWVPGSGRYVKKEDLDGPHQKTLSNWKATYGRSVEENEGRTQAVVDVDNWRP